MPKFTRIFVLYERSSHLPLAHVLSICVPPTALRLRCTSVPPTRLRLLAPSLAIVGEEVLQALCLDYYI